MNPFVCYITTFLLASTYLQAQPKPLSLNPLLEPFYHGVASGDPESDRVIIWTRVTPDSIVNSIPVSWQIAIDTGMTQIVNSGNITANATNDYTVKVDVTNLQPNTYYYYEFSALNKNSLRGRTKTIPVGNTDSVRFAVVSCANYEAGYFNAYDALAKRNDIDAVLHLGDYIYEYETGGYAPNNDISNRDWAPANEILDLTDYRTRFSSYHLDEDLLKLHQQYPMIVIWDDHEFANNSYKHGAKNHNPSNGEGLWKSRKAAAMQAFNEWIPIRQDAGSQDTVIFRKFQYGNLLNLYMLDTRVHGRDAQNGTGDNDINRTILGHDQYNWLTNELSNSSTQWNIIGQQVMFSPLKILGVKVNEDQWHGYPAERERFLDHILLYSINDVVVLTGDIHSSWAFDLKHNSQNAGVEFVTPSITSPGLDFLRTISQTTLYLSNSSLEWVDLSEHGYTILDINKSKVSSEWYFVSTIDTQTNQSVHETSYCTNYGDRFISPGGAPIPPRKGLNELFAPDYPRSFSVIDTSIVDTIITGIKQVEESVILGAYPNPVNETLTLHFYTHNRSSVSIKLHDLSGKLIEDIVLSSGLPGIHIRTIPFRNLSAGIYILTMQVSNQIVKRRIIKK